MQVDQNIKSTEDLKVDALDDDWNGEEKQLSLTLQLKRQRTTKMKLDLITNVNIIYWIM